MRLSRFWLALILIAFCLPLFVGLGASDLETDEAIYSFAVDRMLETGDWLVPKSSPTEDGPFLEKPPLKFWIVALPIRMGLLPHNEFGLRFVDAVEGSLAFVYVFALGSLLAGPICGAVAVLLLFVHTPLLFTHGLRTNNMEASLVLSYCAGVFHTLRWARLDDAARRRRHAVAATLALVLGFMTKFVAVLFLPMTLGVALLLAPRTRERLLADWRTWTACVALFIAVCAPWFVYASVRFGSELWATILGQHVIQRMTAYLDPSHLHPWNYYFVEMWKELSEDRVQWLIVAGLITLLVQTVRRRWLEGAVVLLWAAVPLAIISAATSKVYHYVYPFLPPLALAGGYLVGLIVMLAPVQLRKLLERIEDLFIVKLPALRRLSAPGVRRVAAVMVVLASVLAVVTVALGAVRFRLFDTIVRNSGVIRPVSLIVLLAVATGTSARRVRLVIALLVLGVMPVDAYRERLELLPEGKHPVRTAAECLSMVRDQVSSPPGLLIDVPEGVWHPLYYYFRHVRPLASAATPFDPEIERSLSGADAARPILISDAVWHEYAARQRASGAPSSVTSPPMLSFLNTTLLLPGPYAACSSEAVLRSPR